MQLYNPNLKEDMERYVLDINRPKTSFEFREGQLSSSVERMRESSEINEIIVKVEMKRSKKAKPIQQTKKPSMIAQIES